MSNYLESTGHLTNWAGRRHPVNPIGDPINGKTNRQVLRRLAADLGRPVNLENGREIGDELNFLLRMNEARRNGGFATTDGKAHFVLYPESITATPAAVPHVIEIDARMAARMKDIKA
jgi:hypothetical protein